LTNAWKVIIAPGGATMLRIVLSMLLLWGVLGSAVSESGCWGSKKGGESSPNPASVSVPTPPKADLYGVVKEVNTAQRSITLSVEKDGEKPEETYEVAKDAKVLLEEPGRLADLAAGNRVALVFDADRKSVVEVRTEPFRIFVKPRTKVIEVNKPFDVELRVINASALPKSFHVMSCSWDQQWQSSNPLVYWQSWGCSGNVPMLIKLPQGGTYEKVLPMRVKTVAPTTFRMGLTPLDYKLGSRAWPGKRTYWSSEVTIDLEKVRAKYTS
jgi:hypothetical protein